MKKLLTLLSLILITLTLTACDKTSVDEDIEAARNNEELITDEDMKELEKDPEFMGDYVEAMMEAAENQKLDENIALIDELEEGIANKKAGKAKGSCNAIADSSTCIEYYGSFWDDVQIEMACDGVYSKDPCPRDMAGGCNTGEGTPADMVAWMYLRGGGEMTAESLKYAKMACDATLASVWIQIEVSLPQCSFSCLF